LGVRVTPSAPHLTSANTSLREAHAAHVAADVAARLTKSWDTAAGVVIATKRAHKALTSTGPHTMRSKAAIGATPGLIAEMINLIYPLPDFNWPVAKASLTLIQQAGGMVERRKED
jgi:hypothetical protein